MFNYVSDTLHVSVIFFFFLQLKGHRFVVFQVYSYLNRFPFITSVCYHILKKATKCQQYVAFIKPSELAL